MALESDVVMKFKAQVDKAQLGAFGESISQLNESVKKQTEVLQQSSKAAKKNKEDISAMARAVRNLNAGIKAFIVFNISRALTDMVAGFGRAVIEADSLQTQLKFLVGSSEEAAKAISQIRSSGIIASNKEIADSFTTLTNLNLDNSIGSIRSYADLAATTGKNVNQLIEAVADASVFEFERSKEAFGIIARQSADEIAITYRGATQVVDRTSAAVLERFSQIAKEVEGADAAKINTIAGAYQNLKNELSDAAVIGAKAANLADGLNRASTAIGNLAGDKNQSTLRAEIELIDKAVKNLQENDSPLAIFKESSLRRLAQERELAAKLLKELQDLELIHEDQRLLNIENSALDGNIAAINKYGNSLVPALEPIKRAEDALEAFKNSVTDSLNVTSKSFESNKIKIKNLEDGINSAKANLAASQESLRVEQQIAAVARFAESSVSAVDKAVKAFENSLAYIPKISEETLKSLGTTTEAIRYQSEESFRNALLSEIGPEIIRDGTAKMQAAWEEQQATIAFLQATGADRLGVLQKFYAESARSRAITLTDTIASLEAKVDPTEKIRQEYIKQISKFPEDVASQSSKLRSEMNRFNELFNLSAIEGFSFDIDITQGAVRNLERAFESIQKFQDIGTGLTGEDIQTLNESALEDIAKAWGITIPDSMNRTIEQFTIIKEAAESLGRQDIVDATIKAIEDANPFIKQFDQIQELYDRIQNAREEDLRRAEIADRDKVRLAIKTSSDLLGIVDSESRAAFNIRKALDVATIASDAAVAVGNILSTSVDPFSTAIRIAGVVAKYGTLLKEVEDRKFGDGSIGTIGGSGLPVSDARPEQRQEFAPGGFTINVYGSLVDEGGLRSLIVDTTKDALQRDELTEDDFIINRFDQ